MSQLSHLATCASLPDSTAHYEDNINSHWQRGTLRTIAPKGHHAIAYRPNGSFSS
ncbi:uncharacterized protein BCR38DRAFT_432179 [Pseudomassariella vexata]|uniref:Uncharacterized protein n=1 Tax=Pseudomassariella vexata TaxID=1141098 RepID=A0A1Y2E116_9PEZI|nr:uncharacterized protein BCR38DRAFT_432179 [Pseudomassariella vexata]ORY65232.1 hypothetical protein BCR38DRAFT_432179 [Pseudomassariella vexata]